MQYRGEIDGLRAVAVVPVIFFHAGLQSFQGGFVGVDVFFVISGYLITSILITDIEGGTFSILKFYERRARRILPALLIVTMCCLPFAWAWMQAHDFRDFAKSLIAVSFFASNILFWRQSNYFSNAAEEKPLLHTWSLAVEEQFYVLFPMFLLLSWRWGRNPTFWMVAGLASLSLGFAETGSRNYASANFYLLPTRAWELFAGVLTALYLHERKPQDSALLSGLGIAAILASVLLFDEHTPSPSLHVTLPVGGTVLIILFAHKNLVARFLRSTPLVGIGLVSYSAYLWHQPLLAFARIRAEQQPPLVLMLMLACASFPLGYLSWKYIETPFRSRERLSRQAMWLFATFAILLPAVIGTLVVRNDGFVVINAQQIAQRSGAQPLLTQDIIVFGDSHADHLIHGLATVTKGTVRNYTRAGCIPFRDVDRYDSRFRPGDCVNTMNGYLDSLLAEDPDALVVLSTMGPVYIDGITFRGHDEARITGLGVELVTRPEITDHGTVFEVGLRQTLQELSHLKRSRVVFAIDVPELGIKRGCQASHKQIIIGGVTLGDLVPKTDIAGCWIPRAEYDVRAQGYRNMVHAVTSEFPAITVFDPTDLFCDSMRCKGYNETYHFLYRDADHLSDNGSLFFAGALARRVAGRVAGSAP